MDSPVGKIVAINGSTATVRVERKAACARCAAGRGCGAGLIGGSTRPALLHVTLTPDSRVSEGDEVRLALEPSDLLRATLLVYGLPLAGAILMLLAGWLIANPLSDGEAVAFAIVGFAAGFLGGRRHLARRDCLKQFVPKITGAVHDAS